MQRWIRGWTVGAAVAAVPAALAAAAALAATASPERTQTPISPPVPEAARTSDPLRDPRETHLRNVVQLTLAGENAEAYWSPDGKKLIFQSKRDDLQCDQIFIMNADGSDVRRVSNGEGKTTCAYFFPDMKRILYSSTHAAAKECPPPPDYSKGYVWSLYSAFDVFTAAPDGSDLRRLTDNPGYDAEATFAPDGSRIIFTSHRDGDLDLYTMKPDGSDLKRVTRELGYDGGAFYSRDGKRIVWRASRPKTEEEKATYRELLSLGNVRPMTLELFVGNADGTAAKQVTTNGAANFGPYFFPDGHRIIFSSNVGDPGGRNFDLWMIGDDGTGLQQITFNDTFDGFPMFSPDGKKLVFASNRNGKVRGETNIFVAEWVD